VLSFFMKETFYFSHDYNARQDPKIKKLIMAQGFESYGLFWAIVEDLYNNANALPTDYDSIAFDLRTSAQRIESIVNDFDLFVVKDGFFGSASAERRLNERNQRSLKARESALSRWNKSERNANALQTQCDSNAIKERKGKEIKIKDINKEKELFLTSLQDFKQTYSSEMIKQFFDYWTELNTSKTKMRFQSEKFFDPSKRLATWSRNQKQTFNKSEIKPQININTI
jgi:hypothetical protein